MPISERLLRRWRKEALLFEKNRIPKAGMVVVTEPVSELYKKILAMTSELLDHHLLRK